jgi:hypothetical protein
MSFLKIGEDCGLPPFEYLFNIALKSLTRKLTKKRNEKHKDWKEQNYNYSQIMNVHRD